MTVLEGRRKSKRFFKAFNIVMQRRICCAANDASGPWLARVPYKALNLILYSLLCTLFLQRLMCVASSKLQEWRLHVVYIAQCWSEFRNPRGFKELGPYDEQGFTQIRVLWNNLKISIIICVQSHMHTWMLGQNFAAWVLSCLYVGSRAQTRGLRLSGHAPLPPKLHH